ncbi:glycosyl transferase [Mycolicibacterium pulveris]|uniref:Glycosyl transferase n=1 Tax=Mycolicibacterium pulveris TaxID=36813 RepID=A0A7I7UL73_MYCPV|nr:glycosyltransferase [Mycolicibacterium pulveris]BBY82135.1 glycosyl transferase [Mycolicibacterium pulveris]
MPERLPVIAAVPNYNMGDYLRRLLPQLLDRGYDRIFVLDDASTDHSVDVVAEFGDVTLVRAAVNRGASANRNQIIDQVDDDVLIHFIDADMDLKTPDTADVARELAARYAAQGVGVIGGLVSRSDGSQEPHNYGPSFSFRATLTSGLPLLVDRFRHQPRLARTVGRVVKPAIKQWPNVLEAPVPKQTYWLHEGNMLIYSHVLKSVGGYDASMREHEAQDLSIRLEKLGIKRQFDPTIEVVHHYVDVRGKTRLRNQYYAARYIIRKHGLARYLTDR